MKTFFFVVNCIITAVLTIFTCYMCVMHGSIGNIYADGVVGVILTACGFFLAEILHELGHMLFGALVKIKAKPKILKFFKSSFCTIIPQTDKNLKPRMIFTSFGGLAINFLCFLLGVVAFAVKAVPVELGCLMPFSVYLFLMNALPFEYSGGKTDGLVISELTKNDDEAKVMLAVLTVQAQVLNGKPIAEADESLLFGVPQIREDDINFIALTELRYEYFKAKGEEGQAEKYKLRLEYLKKEYM